MHNPLSFSGLGKINRSRCLEVVILYSIASLFLSIAFTAIHVVTAQISLPPEGQRLDLGLYNNSTYGLSFMYPVDWYKSELLTGPIIDIKFLAPSNSSSSIFTLPTIDILIDKSLGNLSSFDEYRALQEQRFNALFSNATLFVNRSTTISNLPAFEKIYVTNQSGIPIAIGQIFTINDNRGFVITYTAEPTEYLQYRPVFTRLAESFTIT